VARDAIGQLLNFVFGYQPLAQIHLVVRGLVSDIENLVPRAHIFFRLAVTFHAPLHVERVYLEHQRHFVDAPMARRAADALIYMNAVVEIDKIGQVVDARPFERFAGLKAGPDRLEHFRIRPELRMTGHASLGGRDSGNCRSLNGSVAIAAIDAVIGDMVLMAERHRLIARHFNQSGERSRIQPIRGPNDSADGQQRGRNTDFRKAVRATVKDLRHPLPQTCSHRAERRPAACYRTRGQTSRGQDTRLGPDPTEHHPVTRVFLATP